MKRFWGLAVLLLTVAAGAVSALVFENESKADTDGASESAQPDALRVDVLELSSESFTSHIPATGTLRPRESVMLVSEVSRQLVAVHAEEGQPVKKGAVLFELDASALRAERRTLRARLDLAMRSATRHRALLREQLTSQAAAEESESERAVLEAQLRALDVELARTVIRAPFDGVLGLRRVSAGAWVTPSTPLISLEDVNELKVDFSVPERHAAAVRVGATFFARVDGLPEALSGKITAIEPSVDERSRSLLVRGVVVPREGVFPGMFAKLSLPLEAQRTLLIPSIAVLPDADGRSVFVVRDGKAVRVRVTLGLRTPDRVQVLKGLKEGDRVIVSNILRVKDGVAVQVVEASS